MADELSMLFLEGEQSPSPEDFAYSMPSYHPAIGVRSGGKRPIRRPSAIRTWQDVSKDAEKAWVYVGVSKRGRVKVGITSNLDRRAGELGIRMVRYFPVLPVAALEIETRALVLLDRKRGDGEWVPNLADEAGAAILAAMDEVRRYRHIDPHLSPDEARLLRIRLATGREAV